MIKTITAGSLTGMTALMIATALLVGPAAAHATTLTRQLELGMKGNDVSSLQTFLATNPALYPQGLITGYYGFLTKSAVSNFQSANGIDPIGRVGPVTLIAINAQMAGGMSGTTDMMVPILSGVSVNVTSTGATVSFNTNEPTKGTVYYDTTRLSEYEYPHSVTIGGKVATTDAALRTSHSIVVSGLQPNTTYFYDVYVTDAANNATMTWQATFHTAN